MKKSVFILGATLVLMTWGCKTQKESSRNSATSKSTPIVIGYAGNALTELAGVYSGILPCADCEGLQTTLTLSEDMNFSRVIVYLGKEGNNQTDIGRFSLDKSGSIVMLQGLHTSPSYYRIGKNSLTQLDLQGNPVSGALADKYILNKIRTDGQNNALTGKKWKLVELNGKPVESTTGEAYFIQLEQEDHRVIAFAGCNKLSGTWEVMPGNRIRFLKMASTMMACPDMTTEQQLKAVLEMTDNYALNISALQLNKARMAPLARFELINE